MSQATCYPAAYPLCSKTAKSVFKALTQFISVFGIPKFVQIDQGSNFTSQLFSRVLLQLQIKHNLSSADHPKRQGALEHFQQTLKSLMPSFCPKLSRDWEEGLPWLLPAATRKWCKKVLVLVQTIWFWSHCVCMDPWLYWAIWSIKKLIASMVLGRLYVSGHLAKLKL